MFLLDGSDDTRTGFPALKRFVQGVVDTLSIGETKDHVSVVQYSREPLMHFGLNTYTEKQGVIAAVEQMNHKGGRQRNTGAALEYVRNNSFTTSSGSRHQEGVPQILILLSGGRSQDDVTSAAAALKQDRIVTFCIGTRTADILEQQMIAHNPSHAFSIPQFDDFGNIQQQLVSFVKRVPRQQPRLNTRNGLGKTNYLSVYLSIYLSIKNNIATYITSHVCALSLCLSKFLQIKLFSAMLYFYWIPRMKCKMTLQQHLALL